jgi:hypothetical protein
MTGCILFATGAVEARFGSVAESQDAVIEKDISMVKHPDANAPDTGCALSPVSSDDLIGADPNDLVVLRALGKRQRMAKTIRQTRDGRSLIEPHDGRTVFHVAWPALSRCVRFERAGGRCQGCGRPHLAQVRCLPDGRWFDEAARTWRCP